MRNIFRKGRPTNFKLSMQMEYEDPYYRQAPWPTTSEVKVARSHDASDRYWPISQERKGTETPKLVEACEKLGYCTKAWAYRVGRRPQNLLVLIIIVALHWVWLVLGWVPVYGQVNCVLVCNQQPSSTQPGHPSMGRCSGYQQKLKVNWHTTPCTNPISMVPQCRPVFDHRAWKGF